MRPKGESGFTILEILIALTIFSMVIVALVSLMNGNQMVFARGTGQMEAQQNARIALETISRELRVAGRDLRGTIALQAQPTAMQAATATSVTFLGDVDNDDVVDKVTYRISGTQVLRDFSSWTGGAFSAATTGVLASNVTGLTFTYYDGAQPTNTAIAAPVGAASLGAIRRVQVGLVGTQSAAGGAVQAYSLTSDVRPRNL